MSASVSAAAPAWLAELSEAWIEAPPAGSSSKDNDEAASSSSSSSSSSVVQHDAGAMLDFGSIVVKDSLILPANSGQLAHAAAALAGAGAGNVLVTTPKTPNRLAALFMRGSSNNNNEETSPTPTPAKEAPVLQAVQEEEEEPVASNEQGRTDTASVNRLNRESKGTDQDGSIVEIADMSELAEKTLPPSAAEFSFHVEKSRPKSWTAHLPPPTPILERQLEPLASTSSSPPQSASISRAPHSEQARPAPAMFKFQHDTQTRRHLRALVEEIDSMATSPPRQIPGGGEKHQEEDLPANDSVVNETIEGLRRSMGGLVLRPRSWAQQQQQQRMPPEEADDEDGRIGNTRSSKRVRLSLSEAPSQQHWRTTSLQAQGSAPMSPARQIIATLSSQTPFSSAARTRLARQYPHTARRLAMSAGHAQGRGSPARRPVLRALPPMSVPARRSAGTPEKTQQGAGPVTPTYKADDGGVTPAQRQVRNKLEEARALMHRIRLRTSERELGSTTPAAAPAYGATRGEQREQKSLGVTSERKGASGFGARPANPTPMLASTGHSYPLLPISEVPTPAEEPEDPLGQPTAPNRASSSTRMTLSSSCLPRRPTAHATLAPPAVAQRPASFSSRASGSIADRFFTSTSTRVPSSSTAATSLLGGSWKPPQAAQGLVHISPEEAEKLLTREVLGDMVYDGHAQRWVKQQQQVATARGEGGLSPIEEAEASAVHGEDDSDDPFRDITGFETTGTSAASGSGAGANSSTGAGHHQKSGSLVLPLPLPGARQSIATGSEKTSTPPLAAELPPMPSPLDVSSIPTAAAAAAPRSVLKATTVTNIGGEGFSTPMPSSRSTSGGGGGGNQGRSVSFSDGKLSGRIIERAKERPTASALRNEMLRHESVADTEEGSEVDDRDSQASSVVSVDLQDRIEDEDGGPGDEEEEEEAGTMLDPLTSTAVRAGASQWPLPGFTVSPGGGGERAESSSAQSTPTAVFALGGGGATRSFRARTHQLSRSGISTTSTTAWHKRPLAANATILTECSFGVSYDRLVQVLTEVAPFEPSWKAMRTLDLRERGIESVVRAKEFLPSLDELDLGRNRLAYLTGLPGTLRFLHVPNNSLSDLTAFAHLPNLETLDVSHNPGLTTVAQLGALKHLRSLKADACAIEDVRGIEALDGLVELSLAGNRIQEVRLETTRWRRLETLDLDNNCISTITGIEALPTLKSISLDHNRIVELDVLSPATELRILKISQNSLTRLDLVNLPNLRTLYADSNRLCEVTGVQHLRNLENFSLREQKHSSVALPIRHLRDLRRLYLSHNALPPLFPTEAFLNLTLLELASCRLSALPADFAQLVPNVRVLLLDGNFLETLEPLGGLKRLHRLSMVGCRLEKVKIVRRAVADMPELEVLDLRLNPMTLSFYPAPIRRAHTATDTETEAAHKTLDAQHRRALPDEWLAKRSAYRSLVLTASPSLKVLDGLKIGRKQRERACALVNQFASM